MIPSIRLPLLLLLMSGCVSAPSLQHTGQTERIPQFGPRQSIDSLEQTAHGYWRARGYGWLIEINEDGQTIWETSEAGCYARDPSVAGASAMLSLGFADMALTADERSAMLFYGPDSVGPVFDRLADLPSDCAAGVESTPARTLDVFLAIMGEHYAHFEARGVAWPNLSTQARELFADQPDEAGLRAAMRLVIERLGDSHTRILIPGDQGRERISSGLGPTLTRLRAQEGEMAWLIGLIDGLISEVLDEGARHVAEDRILWGTIDGRVGYVQVFQMGGYTGLDIADPDWARSELALLDEVLDEAFDHFDTLNVEAVILDLSNNRGGYDEIARRLAARFTESRFHAYSVSARGSGLPALEKIIEPEPDHRFTGPVFVLTSDVTVSGGEIAALSLRQLPNVTQVGQPTRGSFSTPLSRALPNGWVVELANETFAAPDGTVYAGRGLPPHIERPVFSESDPVASHLETVRWIAGTLARNED